MHETYKLYVIHWKSGNTVFDKNILNKLFIVNITNINESNQNRIHYTNEESVFKSKLWLIFFLIFDRNKHFS